jgi:hypothetical protein
MFADEAAAGSNNPLFARKRVVIKLGDDDSVSTDSSDSDSDEGVKSKKKAAVASPLAGLSRRKSIKVLEQQVSQARFPSNHHLFQSFGIIFLQQ